MYSNYMYVLHVYKHVHNITFKQCQCYWKQLAQTFPTRVHAQTVRAFN